MTDIIAPTSVSLQATHTLPTDHNVNNSAPRQRRQRPPQQQQQQQQADAGGSSEKKINTRRRRPNRNEGTSSQQQPQNERIDSTQTPTETSVSTPTPEQKTRRQGNRRSNGSSSNKNSNITGSVSNGQNAGGQTRNGNRLNGRKFQAGLTPQDSDEPVEATQQKKPSHQLRSPAKFVPKIEADHDLLTSLTVGLTSSKYECMVCFDVIRPAHKIWNCQVCWAAFHLDCLSTWAKKSVGESSSSTTGWRCPGCQHVQVSIPKEYNCFCGKVQNPEFNRYFTPHSCGELCGRSRDCSHSCNLPCHPGPCPPCGGLGPIQYCHCGSESFQLRCVDTDFTFTTGKSCDKICGELLGCGAHTCASACHPELCPPCNEDQEQICYCGKHTRTAKCGEGVARITIVDGEEKLGYYECTDVCDRLLVCGNHRCTKDCHVHNREPGPCSALPENVKTCPCGSKTVDALLDGKVRTSCLDPIPVCGNICQKVLDCGHSCTKKCHRGKCGPCKETILVDCLCGSTHVLRVCSEMSMYGNRIPTCEKLCRGLRSCGKHQCTNRCCPAKNPSKSGKVDQATHEAHACTLVCGKKLKCGIHTCEMPCHKGHCDPCMNASFEDLSCSCGKTVMLSPIPCGTTIPKCRYTCTRSRECGHASLTSHPCHPDSEPCPPCIMLVPKQCMCRRSTMPNVPCYKSNPSCGRICGKRLDCDHKCIKSCHSGECLAPGTESCTQSCPKLRKSCGHRCGVTCHGQGPCAEDQPCPIIVPSSCKCGTLTKEAACLATKENPYDGKPKIIKCNDYCLIAERNKRVAIALDIDESAKSGPRIPEYADHILDFVLANMDFTLKLEKQLADWVADESKPILYLQPMKGPRRKFTHELAAHYNVMSESVDVEPYRSVTVRRKLNTSVPGLLASQACRQKRSSGHVLSAGVGIEQLRKSAVKEPVNAIYLHELVFGLTRLELAEQLAPVFGTIKYGLRWLTDDDAVLIPHPGSMQMDEFENLFVSLRSGIKTVASMGKLCDRVELCWVNKEGEVVSQTANNSSKRFFTVQQGNQWNKKLEPAKVANAFALLDDDERVAAAKKAEEEKVLKAKEAAGTLSLAAWEEAAAPRPSSAEGSRRSTPTPTPTPAHVKASSSSSSGIYVPGAFTNRRPQEVVDDWEQLLESEDDDDDY
ncbi:FKBP12-associated protein [Podila minutissima]|nr:FKBP12-associated protein [Podila minutissima]